MKRFNSYEKIVKSLFVDHFETKNFVTQHFFVSCLDLVQNGIFHF